MSFFRPRNLAIAGGVAAAVMLIPRSSAKDKLPDPSNVFETPGVKNIGAAHARGGGSTTHTTGVATQRGSAENVTPNQENPKGVDTAAFQENHNDQKVGKPGLAGDMWHKAHYGENNTKGK